MTVVTQQQQKKNTRISPKDTSLYVFLYRRCYHMYTQASPFLYRIEEILRL